ncbi:MAG: DUF2868 domain-containing protein [Rubrivivax sp.]|nr:DUF2868 domain-containing protein [Rubrivivax sp.]
MTEDEARQVLLLQSREATAQATWPPEDRAWATRHAVAAVGDGAPPERFVVARAVVALQRLLPRDEAARRWLARRGWHGAWVAVAVVLAFLAGVLADQLGPPQRVNLLAPAVWAVVGWNLLVYLGLLLPLPSLGLRDLLARRGLAADDGPGALWARHAAPLMTERAALVLHAAAAALGAGLVASFYLRGLVLDYRAGWQSTFLDAAQVQRALGALLSPASALTGIGVPDVAPLRLGPGADASASAAPWIHLYATTLALAVVLPRLLLALRAGARAAALAARFPLPLDDPYFEALHPLMRPNLPRAVRLLWLAPEPPARLFGTAVAATGDPITLLESDEGDRLELRALAPDAATALQRPDTGAPWWAPWRRAADPLAALREGTDAVLLVGPPGAPRPAWLARLARPVLVLCDGETTDPAELSLLALDEGWVADARLMQALRVALPEDPRLARLADSWRRRELARFDTLVAELADTLARLACRREAVADEGLLGPKAIAAEAARQALLASLDGAWRSNGERLATLLGQDAPAAGAASPVAAAGAALRPRMGEGRTAMVTGVLSGVLAGLKADLATGGLTMGAGALTGAVVGAIGARGVNLARGTERSHVAWNDEALTAIAQALLERALVLARGWPAEDARARLAAPLAAQGDALRALWRTRGRRADASADAEALALLLRRPLADVLRAAVA